MAYTQITYEKVARVARITMNRPQYRNAIGRIMLEELDGAFDEALHDAEVGVVVLSAEGEHFSAGHDLGTPEKVADDAARPYPPGPEGTFIRTWELYIERGLKFRNFEKPTIAVVQGKCIWGGWMLASAMDIIFASEDATFLGANFQYFCVPWDVGIRKAKEILFEPRFISASEALSLGFVNRVLPISQLDNEAMQYAARIAENDPFSLRMTKLNINQAQDLQGYTNHIISVQTASRINSGSQGYQFPSGARQLAPVPKAEEGLKLSRGVLRAPTLDY